MTRALVRLAISGLLVAVLLAGLILLGPGRADPIGDVDAIARGRLCEDPRPDAPCTGPGVDLPFSAPAGTSRRLRFDLPKGTVALADEGPLALYFPLVADGLDAFVNGAQVLATAPPAGPIGIGAARPAPRCRGRC